MRRGGGVTCRNYGVFRREISGGISRYISLTEIFLGFFLSWFCGKPVPFLSFLACLLGDVVWDVSCVFVVACCVFEPTRAHVDMLYFVYATCAIWTDSRHPLLMTTAP